jgi:SAM-dependent methyltransferase
MEGPSPYVVAMIGRAGLGIASVPVQRAPRHDGFSAYGSAARLRSAARGLRWSLVRSAPERGAGREGHNEIQRRYYRNPSRKPGMLPRPSRYLERQVDEMIARTGLRPSDRVLDVGAGMGRYTLPLADRGLAVEAIDLSPELLAVLRERAGDREIPTHHADVIDLVGSHAGAFDAVIGFFVLHHMHDVPGSMQAMAKLLRPGGRLGFLEPNPYNPLYYVQMAVRPSMTWEGDGGIVRMRRRPLVAAVRDAGLLDARLERFGMFPPQVADHRGALPVERLIERVAPLRPVLAFQVLTGRAP